jgi:hypothetical protein
MLGTEEE